MTRPPLRARPLAWSAAGTGRPVLALHGLGGDREQALRLLPAHVALRRIAIDLPGHGDTDLEDTETIGFAGFAEHAAAVLDGLHRDGTVTGPIPVVGVSMGAGVALALAHRRPDLVAQLVLVRPAWLDVTPPPHLAVFPLVGGLLLAHGPERGARILRHTAIFRQIETESAAMAASLLAQFTRRDAVARARVLVEIPYSAPLPSPAALRGLDLPVVVVGAPHDPVHPQWLADELAARLPAARLAVAPRKDVDPSEHEVAVRGIVGAALGRREHR